MALFLRVCVHPRVCTQIPGVSFHSYATLDAAVAGLRLIYENQEEMHMMNTTFRAYVRREDVPVHDIVSLLVSPRCECFGALTHTQMYMHTHTHTRTHEDTHTRTHTHAGAHAFDITHIKKESKRCALDLTLVHHM
jgi:hypothetical protein